MSKIIKFKKGNLSVIVTSHRTIREIVVFISLLTGTHKSTRFDFAKVITRKKLESYATNAVIYKTLVKSNTDYTGQEHFFGNTKEWFSIDYALRTYSRSLPVVGGRSTETGVYME